MTRAAYEVIVHADLAELAKGEGGVRIEDGGSLAPATLERILCDCAITTITSDGDGNVNAGRKTRRLSRAMRRALHKRDSCCQYPGCTRTAYTQAHHIVYWTEGGATDLENLMRLCWIHHRAVHEGKVTIHRRGEVFEFRRADGSVIAPTPSWSGSAATLQADNAAAGVAIDDATCFPDWGGEPGNLRLAADLMLQARGSPA